MKELLSKGLGIKVRQADPILPEDEEKNLEPKSVRNAIFGASVHSFLL